MNIVTIGSCLSDMTANRAVARFGSKRFSNVVHHRSDQFYHYYIKKDKNIVPREWVEKSLKTIEVQTDDPNYISFEAMLNNQYQAIGQHRTVDKYDFFNVLENKEIDVFILDNYVDMSAILSYPKLDTYRDSPLFLRKNDFENYEDFFIFGKKITTEKSIFYFQKIIEYLHKLQPNAAIYFIHYPYNTYEHNPQRVVKAKEFEKLFHSKKATIIPAPYIKKPFQLKNDPAHFEDSIYVALAGFINFHYNVYFYPKKLERLLNDGKIFHSPEEYFNISEITFTSEESWTVAIKIYEFENDQLFNFFFGKRGTRNLSILRRKNILEFRADDGSYIGGVEFLTEMLNEVVITYDKGNFLFYNNGKISNSIFHPSDAVFNAIGSGYDGKNHEQPCIIFQVSVWNRALNEEEMGKCFEKKLLETSRDLIDTWDFTND